MNQRNKLNTTGVLNKTARICSRCQNISQERPTTGATADLSLLLNKTRARRSTYLVVLTTIQPRLTTAVMSHSLLILISQMLIIIVVIVVYLPVRAVGPRNNVCTCVRKGHLSHMCRSSRGAPNQLPNSNNK